MSTLLSWLIAGIKLLVQIIVITWTTLAIYFSNLPWSALRLGLAVAFAAFAIWAFWLSRRRRSSNRAGARSRCLVAHHRSLGRWELASGGCRHAAGVHRGRSCAHNGRPQLRLPQ